jgi:glycosyltransferase involved in cell wall biosynthesis
MRPARTPWPSFVPAQRPLLLFLAADSVMFPPDPASANSEEMRERLTRMESDYRAALERAESTKNRLRETEKSLEKASEKVRGLKRKGIEADHYRSLLHQLRSRWYLRPFIPRRVLEPPPENLSDCWYYRGPHFDPPRSDLDSEQRRHRVLVVGHLLSGLLFGSENSLLEMLAAIDPSRFDLFAVFPEKNERVFAKLRSFVQGIAVLDYGWWRKDRPFQEETVVTFEKILRQCAIHLVHANTIMLSDPAIAARRVGIPVIINARELISLDRELAYRLGASPAEIVKIVCDNATYLLANSAATLADYPCRNRGGFIYNSVDVQAFDFPNAVDPGCIKVGLISSNIPKKGIFDFLQLAREAVESIPALQFHLLGPENDIIKEWQAGTELLPSNFRVRGYISPPVDAYRDLNIVLNLSHCAESFGRTVAEAMAARRPVIAYDYGALPELIEDGKTGFLVPYLDLSAVFGRVRFFVEHPQNITAYGEAGRSRIMQLCSPEAAKTSLNALYERLIAQGVNHTHPAPIDRTHS